MGKLRWVGAVAFVGLVVVSCNGKLGAGGDLPDGGGGGNSSIEDASVSVDSSMGVTDAASDTAVTADASAIIDATSDASSDAGNDAAVDAADDAAVDAGVCLDPADPDYPLCNSRGCLGGCDISLGQQDPRSTCRLDCGPVCPPEPVFMGVCPVECNAGCPGGVCNIDGALPNTGASTPMPLPSKFVPGQPDPLGGMYYRTVCPEGLPCKVSGGQKIFCPRTGSCEVTGDANTHVFCGSGPCTVHRHQWLHGLFPNWEYNYSGDVCGDSCDCKIPYDTAVNSSLSPTSMGSIRKCACKDGTLAIGAMPCNRLDRSGCPAATRCPVACAAHGGWADL